VDITLKILLVIHIISGFLTLLNGCISIAVKKGGKVHRLAGKIFFFSMLGVTVTALVISIAKNNQFLLLIAIFSFYQTYMGFRAVKDKSLKPSKLDRIVLFFGALNTFFMIYSMHIVLMIFGGIGLFLVVGNLRVNLLVQRKKNLPQLSWLKRHIGMMMGSYISTVTAFVVVNSGLFASLHVARWLPWLLPSVTLFPWIVYFTRKYAAAPLKKRGKTGF